MPRSSGPISLVGLATLLSVACAANIDLRPQYPAVIQSFIDTILNRDSLWFADSGAVCLGIQDTTRVSGYADPARTLLTQLSAGPAMLLPISACDAYQLPRFPHGIVYLLGPWEVSDPSRRSRTVTLHLMWHRVGADCTPLADYFFTRIDSKWQQDSTTASCAYM